MTQEERNDLANEMKQTPQWESYSLRVESYNNNPTEFNKTLLFDAFYQVVATKPAQSIMADAVKMYIDSHYVDVKDVAFGDKNIFEVKL